MRKRLDRTSVASAGLRPWLVLATAALYVGLILLYAPSLSAPLLSLDDRSQLEFMRDAPWQRVLGPDQFGHLRPAKNLLFLLLARAGDDIAVFRAALLTVFLLTVALVQRFAAKLAASAAVGLAAAACWAWNPTAASVVCWLSAANIALCTAAVLTYVLTGSLLLDRSNPPAHPRALLAAALLALLAALACYELALLAPVVLLLYQWMGLRRERDFGHGHTRALYLLSAACITAYLALRIAATDAPLAYRSAQAPAWLLTASAPRYFAENALLWLWPWARFGVLWFDDPAAHTGANLLCWGLLLAAAALLWHFRRHDAALCFGLIWFAFLLLPLSNLIPLGNTPVAQHYLYLPSIGLALALCRAVALGVARVIAHTDRQRTVCAALALAACLAFLPETRRVAAAFADEEQLYALAHANHPDNVEVLVNLARVYLDRGKIEPARHALDRAARLAPTDHGVLRNRYALLLRTGQPEAALAITELNAVRDLPEFMIRRGELLLRFGRHAEAAAVFERALQHATDRQQRLSAGYQLVIALLQGEQIARARALVEQLLAEYPGQPQLLQARELLSLRRR